MYQLPNDIKYKIYEYKHQLDFKDVMKELKKIVIRCFFNIDVGLVNMCYLSKENNILCKCINIMNLNATPKQILNTIKK